MSDDAALTELFARTVNDPAAAVRLVRARPALARAALITGASRADAERYFLAPIAHHVYAGDTALHVAAAAHATPLVRAVIALGAATDARNRRGQSPLHYAADGGPGVARWRPRAQAGVIHALLAAGADPNARDRGGTTPLHRAVRNRCALAVAGLLAGGADPRRANDAGATALALARTTSGRGGSGTAAARAQAARIIALLTRNHSTP